SFIFEGFMPKENKSKRKFALKISGETRTVIVYETPHRLQDTLKIFAELLPERKLCVGREITKKFEEFWRGLPAEAVTYFSTNQPRGEFCIVIEGGPGSQAEPKYNIESQEFKSRL